MQHTTHSIAGSWIVGGSTSQCADHIMTVTVQACMLLPYRILIQQMQHGLLRPVFNLQDGVQQVLCRRLRLPQAAKQSTPMRWSFWKGLECFNAELLCMAWDSAPIADSSVDGSSSGVSLCLQCLRNRYMSSGHCCATPMCCSYTSTLCNANGIFCTSKYTQVAAAALISLPGAPGLQLQRRVHCHHRCLKTPRRCPPTC